MAPGALPAASHLTRELALTHLTSNHRGGKDTFIAKGCRVGLGATGRRPEEGTVWAVLGMCVCLPDVSMLKRM